MSQNQILSMPETLLISLKSINEETLELQGGMTLQYWNSQVHAAFSSLVINFDFSVPWNAHLGQGFWPLAQLTF